MNPLPPQAYTKETLGKAFAWLQTQNESIKEMATSPDILVSLYLKAKLNGESALERPSIKNFKSELKSLAGMMGEFESQESQTTHSHLPLDSTKSETPKNEPLRQQPESTPRQPEPPRPDPIKANAYFHSQVALPPQPNELDPLSKNMIREVKNEFNLSSDHEALRLLISVGFKSIKKL